jgi:tetratricopeptide (TPR) repeat protein
MYEGKYIEAHEALVRAKICHPESPNLDLLKVEILMELEEYDKALKLAETLEAPLFDRYELYYIKAQIHLELDNVKAAVKDFKAALERCNAVSAHDYHSEIYNIPGLLMDRDLHKEALYFLRKFMKIDDGYVDTYWNMAVCHEKTGATDKAEKYYEKALDINPFNECIWNDLGLMHISCEKYEKALNAFEFALAINDNGLQASIYKSNVLMLMNEYDRAIEWIESQEIKDAGSYYMLGKCYEEKQEVEKAVEYYTSAIKKAPEFTPSYWCMAKIMYQANDAALAVKLLEKAIEYEPNNMDYMLMRTIYTIGMMIGLKLVIDDRDSKNESYEKPYNKAVAAALLYYLGDLEGCCKKITNSLFVDENAIEKFFEQAPEAKENTYIINYLKMHIKK